MRYKCPLCLKELTETDQLVRFCRKHGDNFFGPFTCTPQNLSRHISCPKLRCSGNYDIEEGVFLMHVGCEAKNPFWNPVSKVIEIPGQPNSLIVEDQIVIAGQSKPARVQHWEIGMMRKVPNMYEEMWFPLMLLRATSDTSPDGMRIGALVELSGAKRVGKTVLALQAMDYQGYVPASTEDRHVKVKGFIFSRSPSSTRSKVQLLSTLYLHTLLARDRDGAYAPQGTANEPGDLKAAFLLPADSPIRLDGDRRGGSLWQGLKDFVRDFAAEVSRFAQSMNAGGVTASNKAYWHSVLFYDPAGEDVENETMMPALQAVDKLAIVIDAVELFGGGHRSSIEAAVQRISSNATGRRHPCCLLVTKLDLVKGHFSEPDWKKVENLVKDMNGHGGEAARRMLIGWLRSEQIVRGGNRARLLNLLEEDLRKGAGQWRNVDRVLFVWTENLTEAVRGDGLQPESHGLPQFICWCLGREWSELNHYSAGAES